MPTSDSPMRLGIPQPCPEIDRSLEGYSLRTRHGARYETAGGSMTDQEVANGDEQIDSGTVPDATRADTGSTVLARANDVLPAQIHLLPDFEIG